jgi:hypothetical protein
MRHAVLLPAELMAMSGLLALPSLAGGAIGQSNVSQAEAIRSATLGMLPGEVITSSNCTENLVDGSTLYSCQVQWGAPPSP